MKKSVEILGLPIISITEGRELGISKTLLIDAKKGLVAAITVEDEYWYRGVKLIPYGSIIAIGDDAITITHSDDILNFDAAGDYVKMLDENVRVLGTKAITKNGTIQGKVSELYIGDDGRIVKCEVTAVDGTVSEIPADEISIFGKQVTMINPDIKNKPARIENPIAEELPPVEEKLSAPELETITEVIKPPTDVAEDLIAEIPQEPELPPVEEPTEIEELPAVEEEPVAQDSEEIDKPKVQQAEALRAALKRAMENHQNKTAAAAKKPANAIQKKQGFDEKRRLMLLGKKAARTIKADTGAIIVEAGAEITEEVLQKAKIANKFIDLSMNYIP